MIDAATNLLIKSIDEADVKGVEQALPNVDVNQREAIYPFTPLWLAQMKRVDSATKNRERHNQIWDLMMVPAQGVLAQFAEDPLAVFGLQNCEAASSVVLAAIRDIEPGTQNILPDLFSERSLHAVSSAAFRQELKQRMANIHQRVHERLMYPRSRLEQQAAAVVSVDTGDFLRQTLPFAKSLPSAAAGSPSCNQGHGGFNASGELMLVDSKYPVMNVTLEEIATVGNDLLLEGSAERPKSLWCHEQGAFTCKPVTL